MSFSPFRGIDLYSDTATRPSFEMKKAMMEAELGDEQKGEDPTTRKLEEKVCELLGTSAALFFPSATMCNQIAVRLHCQPGTQMIAAENCHIFEAEAGGFAVHSGVAAKPIPVSNGIFSAEDVDARLEFSHGPHSPPPALISVENTTNMGGGIPWPRQELDAVLSAAEKKQLKIHLDGSRLFNASVATQSTLKSLARGFDTVTLCLSKGLGCPVGAVLAFDRKHFSKIRRLKQLMGGALRQSGILAAAGLYALENNIERLAEDHANAKLFYQLASDVHGIHLEEPPSTNMIFFKVMRMEPEKFLIACKANGLQFSRVGHNRIRAVTHMDVSSSDIENAIRILKKVLS